MMKIVNKYRLNKSINKLRVTVFLSIFSLSPVYALSPPATQYSSCIVGVTDTDIRLQSPRPGLVSTVFQHDSGVLPGLLTNLDRRCIFNILPSSVHSDNNFLSADCPTTTTEIDQTTNYMAFINVSTNEYCLYQYDLDTNGSLNRRRITAVAAATTPPPPSTPINTQSVPIFSPLGILAMLSGLLWFGRRNRAVKQRNS